MGTWHKTVSRVYCKIRDRHLTAVDILQDPHVAADACPPARRSALAALTTAAATIAATEPESSSIDEWPLTIEDLMCRTGKSRRWLFEHSKDLPFVRRLTARTLVGDAAKLNSWLEENGETSRTWFSLSSDLYGRKASCTARTPGASAPVNGRRVRESAHTTNRADATKLLKKRLSEAAAGKPVGPERTTLAQVLAMVEADYKANGRRSLEREMEAAEHLKKYFGSWRLGAYRIARPHHRIYRTYA